MSKQTAPPKNWGEVSREELIKREFEMVKRIEKEELTFDGLTPIEFALRELYEFQEATGCDTAAEFKTNLEKDTEGYMQKVIDALYENGDPVSVEAAELFEHMAQQRLKPVACGGEQEASYIGHDCAPYMTDSMKVFCPACCTKFRAIPSDVQKLLLDAGFEPPFTSLHPSQPEQEPVAWCSLGKMKNGLLGFRFATDRSTYHDDPDQKPLYTTPPQRTWVGLTDDEIMDIYNEPRSDAEMIAFGREVEAKLKEKNA